MWSYVKAAFFVMPRMGPLGPLPVNALLASAFLVLGIVQPALWLLGAGVMTIIVAALATSPRFKALVDAQALELGADRSARRRQELIASLDPDSRQRLANLQVRAVRIMEVYRASAADPVVAQSSRDALNRLEWIYLKLLIARRSMGSDELVNGERQVRSELKQIDQELASEKLPPSIRESRRATRELLLKRLENAEHRRQSLAEIESDLQRIDAQVDLAHDDATLRGKPAAIGTNIQLASQMLDTSLYGASSAEIAALDESLGLPPPSIPSPLPPPPLRETER